MIIDEHGINNLSNPFDSVIEKEFAHSISKYLRSGIEFDNQIEFKTQLGYFKGDFIISNGKTELLVELDGKEFHQGTRDKWRDAFILGEKKIDSIIRFQGKDITYCTNECIFLLTKLYPDFFHERAIISLSVLVEKENQNSINESLEFNFAHSLDRLDIEIQYEDKSLTKAKTILKTFHYKQPKGYWTWFYEKAIEKKEFNIERLSDKSFIP